MAGTIVALVVALALAVMVAWLRRRAALTRERQRRLRRRLEEVDERLALGVGVEAADRRHLTLRGPRDGTALVLPYERCERASPQTLLEGARHLLDRDASGHDEALVLRRQGTDIAPYLVRDAWLAAFPGEDPVPSTPLGGSGLAAVYRLLSHPGLRYLTAPCLEATGVRCADLHDAVVAMLRQRFDEDALRRTVEGGEMLLLEDDEDRSAAYLFLVPELLAADEELFAAVPRAGGLALARRDGAERLEALLRSPHASAPLAPGLLRVRREGIESA